MAERVEIDIVANDKATATINNVDSSLANMATGGISGIAGFASSFVSSMGIVTTAIGAVAGAFQQAFEYGEIAAGNQRLIESGELLAARYGDSMDEIVRKVKAASLGTVSEMDIIRSSNKAMMLGVAGDSDKLASLMEVAAFRARAMGITTQQAFDDIARGIGRSSPMILDNLGIVIDAKSTYAAYAESIGKSANELSKQEKTQALLNKVLEEGNKQIADAGGLTKDSAASYERWNAELQNTKDFLAKDTEGMSLFAEAGADLLVTLRENSESILTFLRYANGVIEVIPGWGGLINASIQIRDALHSLTELAHNSNDALSTQAQVSNSAADGLGSLALSADDAAKAEDDAAKAISDANKSLVSTIERLQSADDTYAENVKRINEQIIDAANDRVEKLQTLEENYQAKRDKILNDASLSDEERYTRLTELQNKYNEDYAKLNDDLNAADQKRQDKLAELEKDHTLATKKIVFNLLEQKLAQEGLTDEELDLLLRKGEAWGIYSAEVVDQARAAFAEVDRIAESVNQIPTEKSINIVTTLNGTSAGGMGGTSAGTSQGGGLIETILSLLGARADGGPVNAGDAYLVGERGAEVFVPNTSGKILPNGGMGGSVNITLNYSPAVSLGNKQEAENILLPFILSGIRQAQSNGFVATK